MFQIRLNNWNFLLKILQLLYYTSSGIASKLDDYSQMQPTAYILASPIQGSGNNDNSTVSNDSFAVASQLQPNFVYQSSMPLNPYNYYYNPDNSQYPGLEDESYRYPDPTYYYQTGKKKSSKSSSHRRPLSSPSKRVKKRRHSSYPSYYKRYHREDNEEDEEDDDDDDVNKFEDNWIKNYGYSNNEHKSKGVKGSRHKYKKGKDSYYTGNDYDMEDNFLGLPDSINSILDYPDDDNLGLGGGGGVGDDLLFGDYEDALQEETFIRPSILGLHNGLTAGLGGIHGIGPSLGLGLGGALTGLLGSSFRTFGVKRLIRNGVRVFIALLLLPLLLLFIPIPIVSSNTNNNNSRDKHGDDGSTNGGPSQLAELSRKMLNSEKCLERLACEINHFNEITGMESENHVFTRFMSLIHNLDTLFPTFLIRMAHGYLHNSEDNRCSRFNCTSLKSHLPSR